MPASRKPIDEALAMASVTRAAVPARRTSAIEPQNHSGATTDDRLIELWLERYDSKHTRRSYANDIEQFRQFVGDVDLARLTVADCVGYVTHLREQAAPATQARRVSSLKSLLSFGLATGYLPFNVGAAIKVPKLYDHLSERILSVQQVRDLVNVARPGRDRALLKFLYFSAARVSEACNLTWKLVHIERDLVRVTLHGKGKKTHQVTLPPVMISEFQALDKVRIGAFVFETCYGNPLDTKDAWRIVRRAAERASIRLPVSPHWLRHAHVSHALDRGAPVHLVRDTAGHGSLHTTGRYAHSSESSALYLTL